MVYVRPEKGGRGSAFCIDPRGFFVASHHVIRDSEIAILVLSSGAPGEMELRARTVRSSREPDLALLQALEPGAFRALPLGPGRVEPGADVTALGFPAPPGDPVPGGSNPPLRTGRGSVLPLEEADGRPGMMKTNLVSFAGNSGGPVLGGDGLVAGVVAEGAPGQPKTFAIPVERLREFLSEPVVLFDPPAVLAARLTEPVDFRCRIACLDGGDLRDVSVSLELADPGQPERRCELRRLAPDVFGAAAAPSSEKAAPGAGGPTYAISVMRGGKQIARRTGTLPVVDLERQLLAHFTFKDEGGGAALDVSGRGLDGTLTGNPARLAGERDGVLQLDGKDDAVEIALPPDLDPGAGMTLILTLRSSGAGGMWMRGDRAVAQKELLAAGLLPGWPDVWGPVHFRTGAGARTHWPVKPLDDGAWHHLGFTRDPRTAEAAMYVDGALALKGSLADLAWAGGVLGIGRAGAGPQDAVRLRGQLDDVRLYGRVLNGAEVRALAETALVREKSRQPEEP